MTTPEQALAAAERWINGGSPEPAAERRRIAMREFDLGWVVWAEQPLPEVDPLSGRLRAPAEVGAACAVVDRATGELSVWPSVPVDEVVRMYRDRWGAGSHDPSAPPAVGPGAAAVISYLDPVSGREAHLVRRSGPGLDHPELRAWRALRSAGVRPEDVLAVHTDLRPCALPGGYCAQVLAAELPDAEFSYGHPYGPHRHQRAEGVRALAAQVRELHRWAGRPAPPKANRTPFPAPGAVPQAGPPDDDALAALLTDAFGPAGVRRWTPEEAAHPGLPEEARRTLVRAGLPAGVPGFFRAGPAGAEAPPGRLPLGTDGQALVTADCAGAAPGRVRAVLPGRNQEQDQDPGRHLNADVARFARCLQLFATARPALRGLDPHAAGRAVAGLQQGLAAIDPTVFSDPENWWAVIVEQLWDGLL